MGDPAAGIHYRRGPPFDVKRAAVLAVVDGAPLESPAFLERLPQAPGNASVSLLALQDSRRPADDFVALPAGHLAEGRIDVDDFGMIEIRGSDDHGIVAGFQCGFGQAPVVGVAGNMGRGVVGGNAVHDRSTRLLGSRRAGSPIG